MAIPHPHLYIEFYLDSQKDKRASREQGRPIYRDVEMVHIRIIGDPTRDIRAPAHDKFIMAPRDRLFTRSDDDDDNGFRPMLSYAEYYHEHYAAFKAMNAQTTIGTPLEMLPFLPKRRIAELKAREVKTVEGLAQLPDRLLKDCGPSTRDERDMAAAWLDKADQAAKVAAVNAEKQAMADELAAMRREIEAMQMQRSGPADANYPAGKFDDEFGHLDDDDLRAMLREKGFPIKGRASREKLVGALRELAQDDLVVEEDAA